MSRRKKNQLLFCYLYASSACNKTNIIYCIYQHRNLVYNSWPIGTVILKLNDHRSYSSEEYVKV